VAVGETEASDRRFEESADIQIGGKTFKRRAVYGDKRDSTRRDIFIPDELTGRSQLPKRARVRWHGRRYTAKLSFRAGSGGTPIPVYTWNVQG